MNAYVFEKKLYEDYAKIRRPRLQAGHEKTSFVVPRLQEFLMPSQEAGLQISQLR